MSSKEAKRDHDEPCIGLRRDVARYMKDRAVSGDLNFGMSRDRTVCKCPCEKEQVVQLLQLCLWDLKLLVQSPARVLRTGRTVGISATFSVLLSPTCNSHNEFSHGSDGVLCFESWKGAGTTEPVLDSAQAMGDFQLRLRWWVENKARPQEGIGKTQAPSFATGEGDSLHLKMDQHTEQSTHPS